MATHRAEPYTALTVNVRPTVVTLMVSPHHCIGYRCFQCKELLATDLCVSASMHYLKNIRHLVFFQAI